MATLRVAIIGGGWIARRHVPVLDGAPDVELVAACDQELARAQAIADPRGAHAYARWEEMLEREQIDALWVCTPPVLHRAPVLRALERGIHTYCEKPIARTIADAQAIVAAAQSSDAICAIGYQWHASELLDEVRAAVAGQSIGLLVGRNYGPTAGRPWFINRAQGGGQILERGSHHIDLQRALAGEITAVTALGGTVALAQVGDARGDIEDVVALTFHFHSGALGSVHMAWTHDGQPELYGVDVIAGDATLGVELGPERFRLRGVAAGRALDVAYGDPFDRSVALFLEAVRSGDRRLVACAPGDALGTLRVAVACEEALASGDRVAVGS